MFGRRTTPGRSHALPFTNESPRMRRLWPMPFAWVALVWSALAGSGLRAGAAEPVLRALATPVTADWAGLPLRQAAARLTAAGGVAVVIDRRLDPDTPLSLHASAEPLERVLARVADTARAEVAAYAGHVRLVPRGGAGPLAAADRLRHQELGRLARAPSARVRTPAAWSWPDGAVPAELVAAAAAEAGITIEGLEQLPHDHFPGAGLPKLSLADRLDLVLAHFDRRVEWQPQPRRPDEKPAFALVALPHDAAAAPTAPRQPPPRRPAPPPDAASTYTLTVAAPLDELLTTLARRLGLTLALDRAALARAGVAPAEIVRLELEDASRERLLDAICRPRGLAWRIEAGTLSVSAAGR